MKISAVYYYLKGRNLLLLFFHPPWILLIFDGDKYCHRIVRTEKGFRVSKATRRGAAKCKE